MSVAASSFQFSWLLVAVDKMSHPVLAAHSISTVDPVLSEEQFDSHSNVVLFEIERSKRHRDAFAARTCCVRMAFMLI